MSPEPSPPAVSDDAVLGGRLGLLQPKRGHRVGHDAILLAAATMAKAGERAVDLGAGIGAAGLALAARVPGVKVTLVEIDPALVRLAAQNAERNKLADRVGAIALDVGAPARDFTAAGLAPGSAARVLMNPPFLDTARQNQSPEAGRRRAHAASPATLATWLRCAQRLLAPSGTLTLIWRADGLAEVLAALARGYGGVAVTPIYPRPDAPAVRILVRAIKGSRAPLALLPGLVLADSEGRPTPEAESILRDAKPLA